MKDTREEDTVSHKNTNQQNNNSSVPSAICPPEKAAVPIQDCSKLYETYSYVPSEEEEEIREARRNRKKSFLKLMAMALSIVLAVFFATFAWFTMNREVGTGGMAIKSQAMPYTIQTRDSSGYYKDKWDMIGSQAMEWKVSATYNFDNHEDDIPADEEEPELEPGDSGMLEFRVNPNDAASITVDCIFDIKAYVETITLDGSGNPVTLVTEIDNSTLVNFVKAHIMLFSGYNSSTGKYIGLIDTDQSLRRVLEDQTYTRNGETYTKIYWVWPLYLSDLTSEDTTKIIFDPSERSDIIAYIAKNRNGFFKDCNDSAQQITSDLTSLSSAYSSTIFNHYNTKYDNADLDIGNNVTYVILSMCVE